MVFQTNNMENSIVRSDLALEAREMISQNVNEDIPGVKVITENKNDMIITHVKVLDEVGEKSMGKAKGDYITIEAPRLRERDPEFRKKLVSNLAENLGKLLKLDFEKTVLVVGLGNWNITPDALGPRVVGKMLVTRHLKDYTPPEFHKELRPVCTIAPGVLGITGIETGEIIKGIVEKIKPGAVIAVDALAARNIERVSVTVQLSNTGIHPGSGIGSKRFGLTQETLGIPVIALGVPTVVHASTIVNDALEVFSREFQAKGNVTLDEETKQNVTHKILEPFMGNLMVTPKEIDILIEDMADIVSDGINYALQPKVEPKELQSYLS